MTIPSVKWRIENRGTRLKQKWFVVRETRFASGRLFGPYPSRAEATAARDALKGGYRP